jgi:DNA-binding transcriptional LysR family regulator
MAEHAIRILLRVDVARSELNAASTAVELLRIVACPQAVPGILPGAVRALRRDHPALAVAIRSVDTATAVARLAAGHADVALIDGIAAPDSPLLVTETGLVASTTVAEEPLVVAFPLGHPLAGRRAVDLEMLVDAPWIVTPGLPTTVALHGPLTYDGGDPALLLGLVASGHGCALLPAPRAAPDGVVGVPLRSPRLVHRVEMLTLRSLGGPIEVLGSELRAALGMLRTAPS